MASCKFFLIRNGGTVGTVNRHLSDDFDALDAARTLCRDHIVEVYDKGVLVARVEQGDKPMNVNDASVNRADTTKAIADFMERGGKVQKALPVIPVTGPEVLDYLLSCGIEVRFSRHSKAYLCKGEQFTLRELVDLANEHRRAKRLPPFAARI